MKGILDRFEGNKAVILIEEKKEELIVDKHTLPSKSDVNTWFHIESNGSQYQLTIDLHKTKQEAQISADLQAKLRAKSKGSKYRKK